MKKGLTTILLVLTLIVFIMPFSTIGSKTTITNNGINISDDLIDNNFENSLKKPIETDTSNYQDGRFIKKLEWISPNGELPGTYTEYLSRNPLRPAHFSTPNNAKNLFGYNKYTLSILVD